MRRFVGLPRTSHGRRALLTDGDEAARPFALLVDGLRVGEIDGEGESLQFLLERLADVMMMQIEPLEILPLQLQESLGPFVAEIAEREIEDLQLIDDRRL